MMVMTLMLMMNIRMKKVKVKSHKSHLDGKINLASPHPHRRRGHHHRCPRLF